MQRDYALVLNAGSSSLKFCVYEQSGNGHWRSDARGAVEGIGTSCATKLWARNAEGETLVNEKPASLMHDARDALHLVASWLKHHYRGAHVVGVGHRVVHGGERYAHPTVITHELLRELHLLEPLAPLHQPYNLIAIEAVAERLPDVPQVACFDTGFHRTQSVMASMVPLPRDICGVGLQRYGFHGLSYEYIASVLPRVAPELARGRIIVAHLGSGASLCAMKNGKSVDHSLGFTALDGLCMGTRPGSLDPGIVLFLFQSLHFDAKQVETILYKESGLLGISGISNDMRELLASDAESARLAVDYFVYRATREIGGLTAVLGGIDGLVFTAGIGENCAEIRRRICASCAWLGVEIDAEANERGATRISASTSKASVWVIPTDEELMIARHTASLLGLTADRIQEAS